jgi:hypothetical protein
MCGPIGLGILGAEPAKDRIYDSPYFIPVYVVLVVFALVIWAEEEFRIRKRRRKPEEEIKDE